MLRRIQELDDRFAGASQASEQPNFIRALAVVLAHSGDSWFWLIGLGLLWWLGSGEWQQLALVMIIGILITAVVQGEWGQIYRNTDPHSFPSGHAARSTMLAVIGVGLGPLWLGLALLIWAPLVGLARIILGVHYPSDILAGMVFGLIIGVLVILFV
jgi:undecaprenyl-diphosphatase